MLYRIKKDRLKKKRKLSKIRIGKWVLEIFYWYRAILKTSKNYKNFTCTVSNYLNLLASLSDSSRVKISPSRTGPLTFRMICRFCSPKNSTFTWVHCPWDPVRPKILITRANVTDLSILVILQQIETMLMNLFFLNNKDGAEKRSIDNFCHKGHEIKV